MNLIDYFGKTQPLPPQPGQTPVPLQRRHFLNGLTGSIPSPSQRAQSPVPLQLRHFLASSLSLAMIILRRAAVGAAAACLVHRI
ncbi:MAG: hypothetical protein R3300_09435 [Candidatus Promineifilaceae bacterium]|nr:hypothetical protein [Candidatus Promineifilaceae bacterium]